MEVLLWILNFLKDFIAVPAFLVGIFTIIGALITGKRGSQVVISLFKVMIGFLILGGGAGVLVGSLQKFQPVFQVTYGLNGVIPNNDGFAGLLTEVQAITTLGSLIMIVGMVLNLGLAIFSRFKYVYLSGHVLFYTSLMLSAVFIALGFNPDHPGDFAIMLFGASTLLGSYMVISPAVQQRHMRMIIGNDEIGLGHTGGFGYAISGYIGEGIGKLLKGKVLSTEAIKFPKGLYFFRNTLVSLSITVLIFYMFAFLPGGVLYELGKITKVANPTTAESKIMNDAFDVLNNKNWIVTMIIQALTFTAGVEIMLVGVRLFIGELIPTFKGISDKLIKNSKAAVDCPVVFPYAPNAVLIGFISSFAAGIIGMGISIGLSQTSILSVVILPGLIPHFFLGATSGVFGNAKGGILGAIAGAFVHGLIITFIPIIFIWGKWVPITNDNLSALIPDKFKSTVNTLNWGDTDYIIGAIPGLFGLINKYVGFAICVGLYIGLLIDGIVLSLRKRRKNKTLKAQ